MKTFKRKAILLKYPNEERFLIKINGKYALENKYQHQTTGSYISVSNLSDAVEGLKVVNFNIKEPKWKSAWKNN